MADVRGSGEAARLAALADAALLDTPPEAAFDDVAQLASAICQTPVALISLVDGDRQWFKARVGFPRSETNLNSSVCRFVVQDGAPVVIPDLTTDPRTRDNPLVLDDPRIRFYAGAPLTTKGGHVLGSLCVIDQEPRPAGLTPVQRDALDALARRTVEIIEARSLLAAYEEAAAARARAEAAQGASEMRWRRLAELLEEGFIRATVVRNDAGRIVDWRYDEVNAAWSGLVGVPEEQAVGRTIRELFPGIEDAWVDEIIPVVETGAVVRFTRDVGQLGRCYDGVVHAAGEDAFVVLFRDVTDRVEAAARQDALLRLGDALRDCRTVGEMTHTAAEIVGLVLGASRAGYGVVDPDVEQIDIEPDWTAEGVASVAGRYRFDDFGDLSADLRAGVPVVIPDVLTDVRTAADPGPMLSLAVYSLVNMPVRERGRTLGVFLVHGAGPRAWSFDELAFIRNVADRLEVGIARLKAEAQQAVLNGEIAHRLKNTLSMVQGIAAQTLRRTTDPETIAAFDRRVQALGRAHDVLLQSSWEAADLGAVLRAVLETAAVGDRCRLEGPPVKLGARGALALSLLTHELATNAVKYGALSADGGAVEIAWRYEEAAPGDLVLSWLERGGPPASPPTRKGFGSRLLRMGLVGTGGSTLSYGEEGFSAVFRAPMSEIEQA